MAQVNISHIQTIESQQALAFAGNVHRVIAKEVHGMEGEIEADAVTVLTMRVEPEASISGAETEVHVLVSGNDWPKHGDGSPFDQKEAKVHFDDLASRIFDALSAETDRKLYVW